MKVNIVKLYVKNISSVCIVIAKTRFSLIQYLAVGRGRGERGRER